ncbi:OmpH family outer membrane protein [Simonsiella muelleri]|uniref:OmpH family outer membrane protein n=1 Tax=Simonsiella muelleri TaxID=72 RepID=UPI0023F4461F|nr:OmpH family outer membrane protein [Simonsiella muelleri]
MTHRLSQVLTCVLLFSGSLNAMAENMKFGYVNAARVYSESQTAQQIEKNLQKEFANQQQKINALQQENNQIREKLVSGSLKASDKQKLETKLVQNRMVVAKFLEDYNLRRNEEFAALQQNANAIVRRLAEQEHFDLIVQEAVFVRAQYDITERVIKLLDAR